MKKRNPLSLRRVIIILLLCLVSNSIMAQTVNFDTSNIDQPNLDKAVAMRKAGKILITSGFGIFIGSNIVGYTLALRPSDDPRNEPFGRGFAAGLYILLIGNGVALASTVVGIPLLVIGNHRIKAKANLALKTFNIVPENSLALGLGISLRF